MLRRSLLLAALPAFALPHFPVLAAAEERPRFRVFRDPGCGCCLGWVRHMEQAGFAVRVEEKPRTDPARRTSGAPPRLTRAPHGAARSVCLRGTRARGGNPALSRRSWPLARAGRTGDAGGIAWDGVEGVPPQTYEIVRYDQAGRYELYARAKESELI